MIVFLPLQSFAKAVVFYKTRSRYERVSSQTNAFGSALFHFIFQPSDWFMHVNLPVYDQGFLISSSFFLCTVKDVFFFYLMFC